MHGYIEDLVDIALDSRDENPQIWGRIAGSTSEEMTMDYMEAELTALGLDVARDRFEQQGPYSMPIEWTVELIGSNGERTELKSATAMETTADGGGQVTAPLVYLGTGSRADLAGRDVEGKVAVIRAESEPHFYSESRSAPGRLEAAGVAGIIRLWDHPGNMQLMLGSCQEIPCFNIGGEDGAFLEAVIDEAGSAGELEELQMSLDLTVETELRGAQELVTKIDGRSKSDENIILVAHADSWFSGATDNASGMAMMLGLAEYYLDGGRPPAHDIYLVVAPGHEQRQGGTQHFVDNNPEVVANNIVSVNLEHVASTGVVRAYSGIFDREEDAYGNVSAPFVPTNWDGQWREPTMSRLSPFLVNAWGTAAEENHLTGPARIHEGAPGEAGALGRAGAFVVQNVEVEHWYHSSGSTAETISPESMERAFLFYTDFLAEVDAASAAVVQAGTP